VCVGGVVVAVDLPLMTLAGPCPAKQKHQIVDKHFGNCLTLLLFFVWFVCWMWCLALSNLLVYTLSFHSHFLTSPPSLPPSPPLLLHHSLLTHRKYMRACQEHLLLLLSHSLFRHAYPQVLTRHLPLAPHGGVQGLGEGQGQ